MDFCRWLRALLDFLGFDLFDMPRITPSHWVAVHASKPQHRRSLVRRLGTRLSRVMKPAKRINFQAQLIGTTFDHEVLNGSADILGGGCRPCANLADFNAIFFARRAYSGNVRLRHEVSADHFVWPDVSSGSSRASVPATSETCRSNFACSTPNKSVSWLNHTGTVASYDSLQTSRSSAVVVVEGTEAMKKISLLEAELAKLREQIAALALHGGGVSLADSSQPSAIVDVRPLPPVPAGVPGLPPLPPPPPPPPPPPLMTPAASQQQQKSVLDIISERKRSKAAAASVDSSSGANCVSSADRSSAVPSMAEVLKGLHTVRLRTVDRSPGGTPVRQAAKPVDPCDPASLIAQALKKKFAHRFVASPDKENSWEQQHGSARGCEGSNGGSPAAAAPTTPTRRHNIAPPPPGRSTAGAAAAAGAPFGQHLLKSSHHTKLASMAATGSGASPLATINV